MDDASLQSKMKPSAGVHITLPPYFSNPSMGLLNPATSDGRVVFLLPWEGVTLVGTTDVPTEVSANPVRFNVIIKVYVPITYSNNAHCLQCLHRCVLKQRRLFRRLNLLLGGRRSID
jgi:hypothetical protein